MASLGAPLGVSGPSCTRLAPQTSTAAPTGRRTGLRITCQAGFGIGAPKPAAARRVVREQSPNRVQALAAPAVERQQLPSPQAASQQQQQRPVESDADLQRRRWELESLYGLEAAEVMEEQRRQQLEQQHDASAPDGALADLEVEEEEAAAAAAEAQRQRERQQLSAAASTSGRGQRAERSFVLSTRAARLAPRGRVNSAQPIKVSEAATAASAASLSSWLLDCSSRRSRQARQPLVVASRAARAAAVAPRAARTGGATTTLTPGAAASSRAATQQQQLEPVLQLTPVGDGLSEETRQDMVVLINTRAALCKGRRTRRLRCGPSDTMSTYLRSLGNTVVLGKEQEARLACILQKGRALEGLAAELAAAKGRPVSDAEVAAAAGLEGVAEVAQRRASQLEAKDLLMQYNVRLVINIAKRYMNNGIDIADLIPEGMVGLSKSIDRFEPSKGFKFSTYAHWWIRQAISRAVCDQARVVRLPAHVCETLYKINRAITSLIDQTDRVEPPGYEEIAQEVGLPVQRVIQYLRLAKLPGGGKDKTQYLNGASLKEVTFDDLHDGAEGDELGVEEESVEWERHYSCMKAVTDLMLSTLPKRERNILRLRYGLLGWTQPMPLSGMEAGIDGDGASMSLGEVAVAYGLSKERIRQIEEKAMRALRKPWRQQLVQELNFGEKVSPSSLTHLASAQNLATEEGSWP